MSKEKNNYKNISFCQLHSDAHNEGFHYFPGELHCVFIAGAGRVGRIHWRCPGKSTVVPTTQKLKLLMQFVRQSLCVLYIVKGLSLKGTSREWKNNGPAKRSLAYNSQQLLRVKIICVICIIEKTPIFPFYKIGLINNSSLFNYFIHYFKNINVLSITQFYKQCILYFTRKSFHNSSKYFVIITVLNFAL